MKKLTKKQIVILQSQMQEQTDMLWRLYPEGIYNEIHSLMKKVYFYLQEIDENSQSEDYSQTDLPFHEQFDWVQDKEKWLFYLKKSIEIFSTLPEVYSLSDDLKFEILISNAHDDSIKDISPEDLLKKLGLPCLNCNSVCKEHELIKKDSNIQCPKCNENWTNINGRMANSENLKNIDTLIDELFAHFQKSDNNN